MPVALKTAVTELPESRVRVRVEVPPGELESRLQRKARELARSMRLPGFRRGKVPAPLVIQRIGREAVLEEAVRDTLSTWYADAIQSAGLVPVGDPSVALQEMPPEGSPLEFSVEIGVLPKAELGAYKGLTVGRAEPEVTEHQIDEQVAQLRERLARLETAQRAAQAGDFVVIDYEGEPLAAGEGERELSDSERRAAVEALRGRGQLAELGAQALPEEMEQALIGAQAGDERTVEVAFPDDAEGAAQSPLAGRRASLRVSVKEVKRKELPEPDDDFAMEAGFDSVQELRDDVRGRLEEAQRAQAEAQFREAALDAAVAQAQVSVPEALTAARAQEMWERMLHSLSHRGISREAYLQIDGRPEEQILSELAPDAERALRREAVITAVVEAEGIEPGEQEIEQALASAAAEQKVAPSDLVAQLRRAGRLEEVREDLAARAAIELIAEHAEPIPLERAQASEKIWTPQSAESAGVEAAAEGVPARPGGEAGKLWTPDR